MSSVLIRARRQLRVVPPPAQSNKPRASLLSRLSSSSMNFSYAARSMDAYSGGLTRFLGIRRFLFSYMA